MFESLLTEVSGKFFEVRYFLNITIGSTHVWVESCVGDPFVALILTLDASSRSNCLSFSFIW